MNKNFPFLVSVVLTLAPLSAVAQMHGQMGGKSNASMPGLIPGASMTNSGSVSMPLMPTANLNATLAAPAPTVHSAMAPAAVTPAATPAQEKPVYAKSLYDGGDEKTELVSPASQRYSGSWVNWALGRSPEKISFDGSEAKSGDVDGTAAASENPTTAASSVELLNRLAGVASEDHANWGFSYVQSYDMAKFDISGAISDMKEFWPNDVELKMTVGVDKVISLLQTDPGINLWLKDGAADIAAVLGTMQKAGLLKAVIARTDKVAADEHGTAYLYFDVYANDGNIARMHFVMTHNDLPGIDPKTAAAAPIQTSKTFLKEIAAKVEGTGSTLVENYDTAKFDLNKSIAALEKRLDDGPSYKYRTIVGADKIIDLLETDGEIKFRLKDNAKFLSARLAALQKAGLLKAVFACEKIDADGTYTLISYFKIYTNDGKVLHLHF